MTTENPTTLEDASRALRAGVIAMLRKPFQDEDLLRAVCCVCVP
jgi:CheY-like chemotaxis protein